MLRVDRSFESGTVIPSYACNGGRLRVDRSFESGTVWWPARIAGPEDVIIPLEVARNCCGNSTAAEYMQDEIRRAEAAHKEAEG